MLNLNILHRIRRGLLSAVLACSVSLGGCGIIIINEPSVDNLSNPETEKNIFDPTETHVYAEYTPYEKEDSSSLAEEYLAALPERNFDGAVFFITTPAKEYIAPDTAGDNVSQLIYERNKALEERYNVTLLTSIKDTMTMLSEVGQAIDADTYYTDLMMAPLYTTGQFRIARVLMNLRSMPFLDLEAPYFNRESVNMTSAGYETYGIAGQATLTPAAFCALFFNRDLVKDLGLDLPYTAVMNNTWTWDTFFTYTDAMTAASEMTFTLGVQNNASRLADLVFVASGNRFINAELRRTPKIAFSMEAAPAVTAAHRMLTDPRAVIDASADVIGSFAAGEMLFLMEYLSVMPSIAEAPANWGVVPLPTENEGDAYRTLVSNNELIFTVPANQTNTEMVSIILSALNAASYGSLYDEYVTYNVANVLRDNDSANMLEVILDTAAFDFALAFGNSYPNVSAGTYGFIRESARENNFLDRYYDAESMVMDALIRDFPLKDPYAKKDK